MQRLSRRNFFYATLATVSTVSLPAAAQPKQNDHWDQEFDAVVIGSGASGLTAATRLSELLMRFGLKSQFIF